VYSVLKKIARVLCVCVIMAGHVCVLCCYEVGTLCTRVLVLHDAGGFLISSPAAQLAIEVVGGGDFPAVNVEFTA
jgi:hypothetical protein